MFGDILCVALGGAVGSVMRFLVTLLATATLGVGAVGTLIVNVAGCFFIGALSEAALLGTDMPARLQLGLRVGLLGGLTTFSSFGYESVDFATKSGWPTAIAYMGANLVFGIAALCGGMATLRALW